MAYITKALKTTLRGVLSANGTSFTVLSFTDHKGTPLTYADFGGTFVVVVEQGEKIELMLINGITQNSDDTATLSIATTGRHLDGKYPYTGYASGLSFTTGASVIVSNDPYTLSRFAQGTIAQSISAIWTFITSPIVPTPTSGTEAANKAYVDGIAIAGSPDASASTKGISMISVAPVSATSPIAVGDNDPRVPIQDEKDAMAGGGSLGTPATGNKFFTEAGASVLVPSGVISAFAGATAPSGYLLCDGSAVSRTTYASLFATTGVVYGAGDGSTTFNVPNLKGRVIVSKDAAQTEFDTLGETGGAKTHTLSESEMPSHRHEIGGGGGSGGAGGSPTIGGSGVYSSYVGDGVAHNNLQPYLVLNYIIKV